MGPRSRLVIFAALFGALYFFYLVAPRRTKSEPSSPSCRTRSSCPWDSVPPPSHCDLWTSEVHAVVTTRGAALSHIYALSDKYRRDGKPADFVTTPDHPELGPLFVTLRIPVAREAEWLSRTDVQDFRITKSSAHECTLSYEDERLRLEKTFTMGASPTPCTSTYG